MKKKKMLKIMKQNFDAHIPANAPKPDWSLLKEEPMTLTKTKKSFFTPVLGIKMALMTSFVIALTIFGVSFFDQGPIHVPTNPYLDNTHQNTFSVSAMSTATLLSNRVVTPDLVKQESSLTPLLNTKSANMINPLVVNLTQEINSETGAQTVELIKPYLEMVEVLAGQDQGIIIVNEVSDNELFEFKVKLTTFDMTGREITHILYFNEVYYDKKDEEEEFRIEGLFIIDNVEFEFIGKKQIEDNERTIEFKTMVDEKNYVESIYSLEENESYYLIRTVKEDIVVSKIEVEIENENNEKEIELRFIDGNDRGVFQFEYEVIDGINTLSIEFETFINNIHRRGEMVVEVIVDQVTGNTTYHIIVRAEDEDEEEYEYDREWDYEEDEENEYDDEEDEHDNEEDDYNSEEDEYNSEENEHVNV